MIKRSDLKRVFNQEQLDQIDQSTMDDIQKSSDALKSFCDLIEGIVPEQTKLLRELRRSHRSVERIARVFTDLKNKK